MIAGIIRRFYGDLTNEELKKYGMLAMTAAFILGTYWLLRPLKDALFMNIVGRSYIPRAKMLSFVLVSCLVLLMSKLVDMVAKHRLFYIFSSVYVVLYLGVAFLVAHPLHGIANTATSPDRVLGWAIYLGVESFASLMVPLFWSFVVSSTDTASAKRGYGLIIAGIQFATISFPALTQFDVGLQTLMFISAAGVAMVPVTIMMFVKKYPEVLVEKVTSKKPTGFLEGLRLLFSNVYLLGVLGVATLYEIIGTIIDYQMKGLAQEQYGSAEKVAAFLGKFAMSANALALVFALLGTSFFIRRFGLTFCMVAFPCSVALVVVTTWMNPTLWFFFGAMVAIKGLSYALNNPCKEIMYIPTSKDVKYKAKGWIDGFGGRSSKAIGSVVTDFFPVMSELLMYGSFISLGIIGIWIPIAMFVGRSNSKLVAENKIIE